MQINDIYSLTGFPMSRLAKDIRANFPVPTWTEQIAEVLKQPLFLSSWHVSDETKLRWLLLGQNIGRVGMKMKYAALTRI